MDAINVLLSGSKQWYLLPPNAAIYSREPVSDMLKKRLPSLASDRSTAMHTCTQHAGDVIYVPALWAHACHNEEFVSGVAVEFFPKNSLDYKKMRLELGEQLLREN